MSLWRSWLAPGVESALDHIVKELHLMSDVTNILSKIEAGDPSAAEKLLPLVYNELRKLADRKSVV